VSLAFLVFRAQVAGLRCLYTGDYSRLPDRHLPAADTPPVRPHIGALWAMRSAHCPPGRAPQHTAA
jgi:hypothetical protein